MPSLFINSVEIEVQPKENIVQAARRAGVEIPHYCWHPDLSVVASCRMCLVEAGTKKDDGTVAMQPRLVPACQTPATPNTVVVTDSPKVKSSQAQTLEYLLLNHPLDCSICDQAGECYLQDYTYQFGKAESRLDEPKVQRQDKYYIGEQIALFTDRCVMCTRCVRFTREYSGTAELFVTSRGSVEEIEVLPGQPCDNKLAGNVVDLCPVGALCSKDFLYKKRVWWLKSADSVCQLCSTGCSITVDQSESKVERVRPRENPQAQGSFMCDDGRFGWKFAHSENRIRAPRIGRASHGQVASPQLTTIGAPTNAVEQYSMSVNQSTPLATATVSDLTFADPWPGLINHLQSVLKQSAQDHPTKTLAVFSPFMTCEEAYLLADYLKKTNPKITLAMGPVPVVGEDDTYPKGPKGQSPAAEKTRFTIRAEKAPNRLGVEAVLQHFQKSIVNDEQWLSSMELNPFETVLVVGNSPAEWLNDETVSKLRRAGKLIVVDILENNLTHAADVVIPGVSFVEKEGTVVNHAGLAQTFHPAIRCSDGTRPDVRTYMELSGRSGLYHGPTIRAEMASVIPAFAAFETGELGELGKRVFS